MAKLLVTDDSDFMRELINDIVAEKGHEVVMAQSGEEMLEKYEDVQPDVVILDVIMGGINGLESMEELKKRHPEAKVIICSAVANQPKMIQNAITKGADSVISKPFSVDQILKAIDSCLEA